MKRKVRLGLYSLGVVRLARSVYTTRLNLFLIVWRLEGSSILPRKVIQYPSDLITYAHLLYQTKPEAKILTVDIDSEEWNKEVAEGRITPRMLERIVFIKGDRVSERVLHEVLRHANGKRGMVLLDSLHSKEHVLKELNLYSKFGAEGSYLIVNNTNDTHLER
jgi:cephalosporin hydroxylase